MLLVRLLLTMASILVAPLRLFARARRLPPGSWLTLTLDGPIVDVVAPSPWALFRRAKTLSLHELSEVVRLAAADPNVKGLVVVVKSLECGMATAASLRRVLGRLRAAGKDVVLDFPGGMGTKDFIVAAGASRVLVAPRTTVAPLGFARAMPYFKSALDKAGVEADVFSRGEFKSAAEPFVRDDMSEANKEQIDALFDALFTEVVRAVAERSGVDHDAARALVDAAPFSPEEARQKRLVDAVVYEDEVWTALVARPGDPAPPLFDALTYLARAKTPLVRPFFPKPCIGVVPVHGAITHTAGLLSPMSTDEKVIRLLRAAKANPRVRGVLLHVDSPGGSALASDRIHREVSLLAREKPVVCVMANVAASGGYYVAAPAGAIWAEEVTLTGSIGVVAARMYANKLYERLGVSLSVVRRGAHAGILDPMNPLTADERAAVERELDATYEGFLDVVAEGRKMPKEKVDEVARGRVWVGKDARAKGLVDGLGGFAEALDDVRARVGDTAGELEPWVVTAPRVPGQRPTLPVPTSAALPPALAIGAQLVDRVLGPDLEAAALAATGERVLCLSPIAGRLARDP